MMFVTNYVSIDCKMSSHVLHGMYSSFFSRRRLSDVKRQRRTRLTSTLLRTIQIYCGISTPCRRRVARPPNGGRGRGTRRCEHNLGMSRIHSITTRCDRTNRMYVGDSLGAIRCWNPIDSKDCCYLSGSDEKFGIDGALPGMRRANRFYKLLTVDGIPVLTESTVGGVGGAAAKSPGMAAGNELVLCDVLCSIHGHE
jgi:hypothetical protein